MGNEYKALDCLWSTPEEMGVMHVSKWQDFHVQFTAEALKFFFTELGITCGYLLGQILSEKQVLFPLDKYIELYCRLLEEKDKEQFRKPLSIGLSIDSSAFYARHVGEGVLLTPRMPYIQVRMSTYTISSSDKILPGALGKDAAFWGLHFSYPLLFMNSKEAAAKNVLTDRGFVNTPLYKAAQRWIRNYTKPATIEVGDTLVTTTMRCLK